MERNKELERLMKKDCKKKNKDERMSKYILCICGLLVLGFIILRIISIPVQIQANSYYPNIENLNTKNINYLGTIHSQYPSQPTEEHKDKKIFQFVIRGLTIIIFTIPIIGGIYPRKFVTKKE